MQFSLNYINFQLWLFTFIRTSIVSGRKNVSDDFHSSLFKSIVHQ